MKEKEASESSKAPSRSESCGVFQALRTLSPLLYVLVPLCPFPGPSFSQAADLFFYSFFPSPPLSSHVLVPLSFYFLILRLCPAACLLFFPFPSLSQSHLSLPHSGFSGLFPGVLFLSALVGAALCP